MHVHTRACLSATCVCADIDPGIFARVVDCPSLTGRKEPSQLFSPQLILQWGPNVEGVDRGGGGTGIEGAESGVEGAESGVEGAGSGSRGGGKRGNCGRGSGKIGGRNCFFY